MKSVLWRVAKCLSYIEDARCLKVKSSCLTLLDGPGILTAHFAKSVKFITKTE